jgi:hypothetical protein
MHSTDMDPGPASVALVLAKMEDMFQNRGTQGNERFYPVDLQSDFSVYANFIQENAAILGMTGSLSQQPGTIPAKISEKDGSRFLTILNRVAKGNEGVSRQERVFIHQFWSEIQKVPTATKNQ